MNVSYQLDISDNMDDEPLGNLVFSDGSSKIVIVNTYIDSWMLSFIENIQSSNNPKIGILEEPNLVSINIEGKEISLFYEGQLVRGLYIDFWNSLVECVTSFVNQMDSIRWGEENETLRLLSLELDRINNEE